jgi:hypothetical protein
MRSYKFNTLLADSRALVTVTCEIDLEDDYVEFSHVLFEGFNVHDVLADNQWKELEWDALKSYKTELVEQQTIDHDLGGPLETIYGLLKPSFYIR